MTTINCNLYLRVRNLGLGSDYGYGYGGRVTLMVRVSFRLNLINLEEYQPTYEKHKHCQAIAFLL